MSKPTKEEALTELIENQALMLSDENWLNVMDELVTDGLAIKFSSDPENALKFNDEYSYTTNDERGRKLLRTPKVLNAGEKWKLIVIGRTSLHFPRH